MDPVLQNIFAKSVQEVSVCFKIKCIELGGQVLIRISSTYYTSSHTFSSAEPDGTIRHFHSFFLRFLLTYPLVSLSTFLRRFIKTNIIACKKCELNSCAGTCARCCVTLTAVASGGERLAVSHSITLWRAKRNLTCSWRDAHRFAMLTSNLMISLKAADNP